MSRPVRVELRTRSSFAPLPYRFARLEDDRVLVTNLVGEHALLSGAEFSGLADGTLADDSVLRELRAIHVIRDVEDDLPLELLALKAQTRLRSLPLVTPLHIFVVTLRCEHACPYCQVSRRNSRSSAFDMSPGHADAAVDIAFHAASPAIKIEFQGGEPLLNLPLIERIIERAALRRKETGKAVEFVVATNLALLDDHVLELATAHDINFSTSLDGPADLHNANRPRPGSDSWQRAIAGIHRIQESLGRDRVSALMTTTERSLDRVEEIIDTYVEHGLYNVFLRPISPYGFAVRTDEATRYDTTRWLEFFERGLAHILELNRQGIPVVEQYSATLLRKILTNDEPRYVDLMSPAGTGLGALVYNYDGSIFASDEGRMLAEMGDLTFRLGHVSSDTYESVMLSEPLLRMLEESFAASAPMCSDCAYEPWCGCDPAYHHATSGSFVGHKALSGFCQRNMGTFRLLLDRFHTDDHARRVFRYWAAR